MPLPTAADTARVLADLQPGQRAWFWLSADVADDHPALVVLPIKRGGDMADLTLQTDPIPLQRGGIFHLGVAGVTEDGGLQLGGPTLGEDDLPPLARWTRAHVAAHPGLGRLAGTTLVNVNRSGIIVDRIEDDSLWDGIARPSVPGTTAEAAMHLGAIAAGTSCWLWMTAQGPSGKPFLALSPRADDSDGAGLADRVAIARARSAVSEAGLRGLLRRTDDDFLVLTTHDDADAVVATVEALVTTHPSLAPLAGVRCIQMQGTEPIAYRRHGAAPATTDAASASAPPTAEAPREAKAGRLARELRILKALKKEKLVRARFWFTDADFEGRPLLVLATDAPGLKEAIIEAVGKRPQGLRASTGVVLKGKKHFLFGSRAAFPGFVEALARWVEANLAEQPRLSVLRNAEYVLRDQTDAIVDRQTVPAAWAFLA